MIGIYIISVAAILHIIWAVAIMTSNMDMSTSTPLIGFFALLHTNWVISAILVLSAVLSVSALILFRQRSATLVFLMPQQVLIMIPGYTCYSVIAAGHYPLATAAVHSTAYIMANQSPTVVIAVLHTAYVVSLTIKVMNVVYMKRQIGRSLGITRGIHERY